MEKGDKVMMIRSDGWAQEGWIGIIHSATIHNARVKWNNGKYLSHLNKDLVIINDNVKNDPNRAFQMHKQRR